MELHEMACNYDRLSEDIAFKCSSNFMTLRTVT